MLTPVTWPGYLTINQLEHCAQADHKPYYSLPHLVLKSPWLKPSGELALLEH